MEFKLGRNKIGVVMEWFKDLDTDLNLTSDFTRLVKIFNTTSLGI